MINRNRQGRLVDKHLSKHFRYILKVLQLNFMLFSILFEYIFIITLLSNISPTTFFYCMHLLWKAMYHGSYFLFFKLIYIVIYLMNENNVWFMDLVFTKLSFLIDILRERFSIPLHYNLFG